MKEKIIDRLAGKKIIILGFGREGHSTYKFIRKYFPESPLTIADKSNDLVLDSILPDRFLTVVKGDGYDRHLNDYDLIIKTPGINLSRIDYLVDPAKITSQSDLFISAFSRQIIGITGTKGKSTTASLTYHILKGASKNVLLAGNIGIPFLDIAEGIGEDTVVVAELSAHQLEYTDASPHIAIMLNLYQEHLDHFASFSLYQEAKFNITHYQSQDDYLIYNADDMYIPKWLNSHGLDRHFLPFSRNIMPDTGAFSYESQILLLQNREKTGDFDLNDLPNLPGQHNYNNVMASILACKLLEVDDETIYRELKTYRPLPHRMEYIGTFRGIKFYDDSISTIPEATMAAVKALKKVDTLILGGFDRGIEYGELITFLSESQVTNVVFTGPAGKRIYLQWKESKKKLPSRFLLEDDYPAIVEFAFRYTETGKICLLSPGASSYDRFRNFEERGTIYKNEVLQVGAVSQ